MAGTGARYVIDTSSLVAAWAERYPIENFPGLWDRVANALDAGVMLIPEEVFSETERRGDDLHKWLKSYDGAVSKPDSAVYTAMQKVMTDFPKLVDTRTGKSGGDPWVIACAMTHKPKLTIVTEEGAGSDKRPKIPTVCAHSNYNIPHTNVLGLIQTEKWIF